MKGLNDKVLIGWPFLAALIIWVVVGSLSFDPKLTATEQSLLGFSDDVPQLNTRLDNQGGEFKVPFPFKVSPSQDKQGTNTYPPVPLQEIASQNVQNAVDEIDQLRVSVIVVSNHRRLALVNNYVLQEGDTLNDLRVEKITHDSILVSYKGGKRWIRAN